MGLSFKDSLKNVNEKESKASDVNKNSMLFKSLATNYDTDDFATAVYSDDNVDNWTLKSDNEHFYGDYSDENISTIDDEKNISLNSKQFNITQEEKSQYIPFIMPRYYDGFDLSKTEISIHYVNDIGYEGTSDAVNVYYNDDKIKFAWLIDRAATVASGTLRFEIIAEGINSKSEKYVWKTKSNDKLNVLSSLSGKGFIEPDDTWQTSFLETVKNKALEAKAEANRAEAEADRAEKAASSIDLNIDDKIEERIANAFDDYYNKEHIDNNYYTKDQADKKLNDLNITSKLDNYYTKNDVDAKLANLNIDSKLTEYCKKTEVASQIEEVKQEITDIDGLANFKVTYDGSKLVFYNGEDVIKEIAINSDPSAEWTTAYTSTVEEKISSAKTEVQNNLDAYKETVSADLESIHTNIDNLPETLKTDYYNKTDADNTFATKSSLGETDTKVSSLTSSIDSNKNNISTLSTKVTELEQSVDSIDKSPRLTYDATYDEENIYTLWEIENEGKGDSERRTPKGQFKIQGGSGGGTSSVLKIEYVTPTPIVATVNDSVVIKYNFSGTDSSGDAVMEGAATWRVGGSIVATNTAVAGENSFDITNYLSVGTQKVNLSIVDDAGSLVTKSWTVQKIDVRIESSFNDKLTYPIGKVSFDYTPYGAVSKVVHFILDGKEIGTTTTSSSGVPMAYDIPVQEHGAHLLEVYMTAEVNGKSIESNHIVKDIIWYDSSSNVPVIGCVQQKFTAKQYDATNIVYTVYDPSTETPEVTLAVDGKVVSTLTIDSNTQTWQYKSSDVGVHTLTITCGETVKTLTATIEKLDVDIEPVTAGLVFDFNPTGKSNNDADRLWSDGDVAMTVSDNFDWVNGGYQIDENGDQYFCVKAGTTAVISYNLFADDARRNGKEFKFIFKTTNVAKSNATFLTCQSGSTSEIGLQMNVHEAYIKSSAKSLYVPYSEEDIIEWEFNINKDTDIPIVMSYEDGTPCRPMSYTSDYSFTQESPVPITIGSPDCDVMIYRMKAYNTSLTSSAILSNFIADARTAEEMIDRYNRNQIYDENNLLTPESVAAACPDMRVIKIEAPHFTNNKKDFVGNTSFECVYKNGDAILDNWKFENCYHSGRTIPCPLRMETCA